MNVFSVLVWLAGLSLTSSSAEASERFPESDLSEESCDLDVFDLSCGKASPDQLIDSPQAGYKQFVYPPRSSWFIDPCEDDPQLLQIDDNPTEEAKEEVVKHISKLAVRALTQIKHFVQRYVKSIYNVGFKKVHTFWKSNCYDWLPNHIMIPKSLGQHLSSEYLDTIVGTFQKVVINASLIMKVFGYGLSYIMASHNLTTSPFRSSFTNAGWLLRKLQCDLEAVVLVFNADLKELPPLNLDFLNYPREASKDYKAVRDWILLREYMNALQWLIEVCNHYSAVLRQQKDDLLDSDFIVWDS